MHNRPGSRGWRATMRDDARAIFDAGVEAVDPDCPIKTKKSLPIREVKEVRDDMPPCFLVLKM